MLTRMPRLSNSSRNPVLVNWTPLIGIENLWLAMPGDRLL
jgi:hypothetical protein